MGTEPASVGSDLEPDGNSDESRPEITWPDPDVLRFWAGLDFARLQREAEQELILLLVAEVDRYFAQLRDSGRSYLLEAQNDFHIFPEEFVGLTIISTDDRCEPALIPPS